MANFSDENFTTVKINKDTTFIKVGDNHLLVAGRYNLKYLTSKSRDRDYERMITPQNFDENGEG